MDPPAHNTTKGTPMQKPEQRPSGRSKHADFYEAIDKMEREIRVALPEGREKALCITHLQEIEMWANRQFAGGRIEVM